MALGLPFVAATLGGGTYWRHEGELLASGAYGEECPVDEMPPQLAPVLWSSKWIPFAYDGSGGYLHVDVSPGAAGTIGQVIQTTSDGEYRYVAPSLRAFFETFVLHLEAGAFEVFDGGLEPRAGDNHWWEHEARGGAA